MLKEIELTYFRQHAALKQEFENGMIALRGAVEKGKSSLLEAIGYAMFGTVALREPLSEVVTWGQKESALKVRLVTDINGVRYHTRRSKSGAEIKDDEGKILAVGQTEVKKYFETLLGASAEVCRNLMMSGQQDIRGALAKGPGAAIELIEELANFALIEKIIGLVQSKLPNGATVSVESRITMLDQQIAGMTGESVELPPLQMALEQRVQDVAAATTARDTAREAYNAVQVPAQAAQAAIKAHETAIASATAMEQRKVSTQAALALIKPVPGPDAEALKALRSASEDAGLHSRAVGARKSLDALIEPENEWEGDMASLQTEIAKWDKAHKVHLQSLHGSEQQIAGLRAKLITETACGLCGKDLTAVPEVVSKNDKTRVLIDLQQEGVNLGKAGAAEAESMLLILNGVLSAERLRQRPYQQHAEFITLDHGYVPARWSWTGPDTTKVAPANAAADYAAAQAQVAAYQRDLGRQEQAERDAASAAAQWEQAMHAVVQAEASVEGAKATLANAATVTQDLYAAEERLRNASQTHQTALQALEQAKAVLAERQRAREALAAQLEAAKKELKDMRFNNALIKALRDARPDIANELWSIVSASVSKYFSDIRGVPSTFGREDGVFKVDGHSVPGLSGSTLDSLGLAIRIALPKTFLPNARFLVLDEASAACDETREAAMVGTVASADFDQVLWATHSDAVQAFAQQTIQL